MKKKPSSKRVRLITRWIVVSLLAMGVLSGVLIYFTRPDTTEVGAARANVEGLTSVLSKNVNAEQVPFHFEDVTARSGIEFLHFPVQRASLLPEDMGSGVACGDYDGDGFVDLFFVNFAGSVKKGESVDSQNGACRLYRNVNGERFEDMTRLSGIHFIGYGMGAAWGDYDNDGDLDLYLTSYGENRLFQNLGDGTFRDVTQEAKVEDDRFSAGCSWGDFDRDGHIDLYVCNYVDFQLSEGDKGLVELQYESEQPFTLNPSSYPAQSNALFRNRGDGTFEEVGQQVGVVDSQSRSLSASWADLDNDGWVDLYVANDVSKNDVYLNLKDGTFKDIGAASLAADYRGAMGIAVSDFDNDSDHDMLISHWIAQENALYHNMLITIVGESRLTQKKLWFVDAADQFGLGQVSLDKIGWATGFVDFDNDGLRDLWVANGSTFEESTDHTKLKPQVASLFWNRGEDGYVDVASVAAERLAEPFVGRGGAQLDFDRDGLMDLVFVAHGSSPILLRNTSSESGNWLRIKLRQSKSNTFALGARAYVTTQDSTQMAEVGCSSSYLSQDELTLHFGLGKASEMTALRIVWPDQSEELHKNLPLNREHEFIHDR